MHPSHRRTLESSAIAPLLLAATLVGSAADARAAIPPPHQVNAPQEPPEWIGDLLRLLSSERVAELELLGRAEGTAVALAQLAKDKEAFEQAAATAIETRGLTANSTQYRRIQAELDATLARLSVVEAAIKNAVTQAAIDAHQTSQVAEPGRAEIRAVVENALMLGRVDVLNQFGGAIEDQLAELALEATHPAALLRTHTRVLATLAAIAPERAVDVALELSGRPGRGWAAAVGQSLTTAVSNMPDFVHVPVGAPGSKQFELALRLLASDEVHVETRMSLALTFLEAGIDDPRLLAASEALAPKMRGRRDFTSSELEWWHDLLLASESQEVRRAAVQARLQYDAQDLALLQRLSQNADAYNRVAVASSLAEALPKKAPISPEYRALWTRALADPDAEVRRVASAKLVARAQSGTFPLSAKAAMELLLALDDPTDAAARADLLEGVSSVVQALLNVATSYEELGEVYAALLDSRITQVSSSVIGVLHRAPHEVSLAVLAALGAPSIEVSQSFASSLSGYQKLGPATAEQCLLAFANLLQRPQQPAALVEVTLVALRSKSRQHSLDMLPPADAVEVLLRSAEAAPDLVGGFLLTSHWERGAGELAAASADSARSLTERCLALIALERSRPSTPQSAAALAESITAAFRDESERESAPRLLSWASLAFGAEPKAHAALLVALLGRAEVPTAAFDSVAWTDAHAEGLSTDEKRALFDALEQRSNAAGRSGPEPFRQFALAALAVMQREPTLVRPSLVAHWCEREETIAGAAAAAVRSSDSSLKAAVRARILGLLTGDLPGLSTRWIAALIHLEGPTAAADDIAELAATNGRTYLVENTTKLLESSAKLREVGARLASASGGASRDAAVTEVLALLDAPEEAVRIEAIRGLATLGAIEHLPRLIRIVGKGTPAERTAARAALDSLHERASREALQSAPAQAPPPQAGDQPRDDESPR